MESSRGSLFWPSSALPPSSQSYSESYSQSTVYPNVEFYENKRSAAPHNEHIEEILKEWKKNFELLEWSHDYIQWLFPTKAPGLNKKAFPLLPEEAEKIKNDPELKGRAKRAFKMMLNFYGMELTWKDKFELTKDSRERLSLLNRAQNHNFLRITRILESLIEFGFYELMLQWLEFLADLIFKERKLDHAQFSFWAFWLKTLKEKDKSRLESKLMKYKPATIPPENRNFPPTLPPSSQSHSPSPVYHNADVNENKRSAPPHKSTEKIKIIDFYKNKIPMLHEDERIEDVLKWKGKYDKLSDDPYYIYWLFPVGKAGQIQSDFELTDEDAKKIRGTQQLHNRVRRAFEMMLDFYGMALSRNEKFEKIDEERLKKLNDLSKPHLDHITAILSSLKKFGLNNLIPQWMRFLADLTYSLGSIPNAKSRFQDWLETLDSTERLKASDYIRSIS